MFYTHGGNRLRPAVIALMLLITVCTVPAVLHAGDQDTRGREFWAAFMYNHGNSISDLKMYAACDSLATVRVTFMETGQTAVIQITQPNKTFEIDISTLFGYLSELRQGGDEGITSKSFHIESDRDITMYGSSSNFFSADAFLNLPAKVLTRRYIVMGYTNGMLLNSQGDSLFNEPSEFAVIGTEDFTTVRISPPKGVFVNGQSDAPFTITLNRGQVFFGLAQTDALFPDPSLRVDVSGTEVESSKPVAVFGGCSRTSVPTDVGNFRDHLVEQMPALESWGREAIVAPLFPITPRSTYVAVTRVLAAADNTTWTLNGVAQPPLQRGRPAEIPITTKPLVIRADGPVLVGEYEHSVGLYDINNQPELGDPFFLIVPPSEQFDTAYAFQSVIYREFVRHFVNVVVPSGATKKMNLDGTPLNAVFTPVPGTGFSYAQIEVSGGSHFIRGDSAFGIYVYGYGPANSYGYIGGMLFRKLLIDFYPPDILTSDRCQGIEGIAFDSRITDSGVDSCYVSPADTQNVNVTIQPFTPGADTVFYSARLVDPYNDGRFGIKAIDSMGRSRTYATGVPGFTLRTVGMTNNTPVVTDTLFTYNKTLYCKQIVIQNYGRYPHTITAASVDVDPAHAIVRRLPLTIAPGQSGIIEVCATASTDTSYTIRLSIGDSCTGRAVADIPVVHQIDTTAPLFIKPTPCGDHYSITYSDRQGSGIQSIAVDTIVNGSVTFSPATLPSNTVVGQVLWRDRHQDLIYQISLTDRAGNVIIDRDTIAGFTVAALNKAGDSVGLRYDRALQGDTLGVTAWRCDTLTLTNYGRRPVSIGNIIARGNRDYSIPPAQFPLVIAPAERRAVTVCVKGSQLGDQLDTLVLTDGCGTDELVAMLVPTKPLLASGPGPCNSILQVSVFGASKRTFLQPPHPNPVIAGHRLTLDIGLPAEDHVRIDVVDALGNTAVTVLDGVQLPAGIHRLSFQTTWLPDGMYLARMRTADGKIFSQKIVITR